jgi:hypothetical protein
MLVLLVIAGLGWLGWRLMRHSLQLPDRFAGLLTEPAVQHGVTGVVTGRARVSGRFRDRLVTLVYRRADEDRMGVLVVAMPIDAPDQSVITARSPAGRISADRELARALVALEARHALRVDVDRGSLRARWMSTGVLNFPGRFDEEKWRDVLENLRVVATRLEDRTGTEARDATPDQAL